MMYPLVRELADDGVPVAVTCRVLNLARQPYYRWLEQPVTGAELEQAYRANALFDAHRDDPEFGYRYLLDEARDAGQPMAERTAWRICSDNGWWSAFGKRKTRGNGKKVGPPVHDDLVKRDFTADAANQLWLTDITEHRTGEGKLYLCAIKDVYSNRIVGYSIDSRMKSRLAVAALNNAVARRGEVAGCIVHSDRGSQFRSRKFVRAIGRHHMVGSMGRVGASLLTGQSACLCRSATRRGPVAAMVRRVGSATSVAHGHQGRVAARGTRRGMGARRRGGCAVRAGQRVPGSSAGPELLPGDGSGLRV